MKDARPMSRASAWDILGRPDVLAGLLFVAIAALGLWISRHYPVGTALRMGTGYMPRLLCWVLLGLGLVILVQGLRHKTLPLQPSVGAWRALLSVTAAIVTFALAIERLGLVLAIVLLTGLGALAARELRPLETTAAALALIALSWGVFIAGLGLAIPVWPDW